MRHRLLLTALTVAAVLIVAVGAAPVGTTSQLLAEHLLHRPGTRSGSPTSWQPGTSPDSPGSSAARPSHASPSPHRTASDGHGHQPKTTATPSPTAARSSRPAPSAQPRRTASPAPRSQHPQPQRHGPRSRTKSSEVVYLTFDDGPGPATLPILSVLEQTGSTATFFQLGINARGQQAAQAAIRAQGSNIGNHSYSHPDLTKLTSADVEAQIADGVPGACFRPPYGATNPTVRRAIRAAGARQVLWTVDTLDWTRPGVSSLRRIGSSPAVHGGSIILMHDGGGDRRQTVAALPALISNIQARGYAVRALPYC